MTEQTIKDSLNNLRDDSKNSNNEAAFVKRFLGGYNKKEVSEYIKTLKDSLKNAEISFRERLEEYAAMSAMLEQERDKYKSMVQESEKTNLEIQRQINILSKENEELHLKVQDIKNEPVSQSERLEYESMVRENEQIRKEINDFKKNNQNSIDQDSIELKERFNELKMTVEDLNNQISDYEENKVNEKAYDILLAENEIINQKYEEVVYENSLSLAEKKSLIEENKRLSDGLIKVNETNKELRNMMTITKLKNRKMMIEFEARAYEYEQNHQKNIDDIAKNIKNTLDILHYENKDFANLINHPFGEFEIEAADMDDEMESTTLPDDTLVAISDFTAFMEKKLLSKTKY